jgi:hypothetical protein
VSELLSREKYRSYSEKDSYLKGTRKRGYLFGKIFVEKPHDKKKEEVKPKISGEKNVSTKLFRVFRIGFSGFVLV